MTKRGRNNKPSKRQLDDALLEPSLVALAKQLNNAALPLQQVTLPSLSAPFEDLRVSEGGGTVTLVGVGAPETGGRVRRLQQSDWFLPPPPDPARPGQAHTMRAPRWLQVRGGPECTASL
jgi:hypothetical protein